MHYRRKKGSKTIQASKKIIDGIKFDSNLESFMYTLLRDNKIKADYEGEKFTLIESFKFSSSCYERTATKPMIDRGNNTQRAITYTPDFTNPNFIIEVKGRANETFPMRWKLFKRWISINRPNAVLYKPQSQADCHLVIEDILKRFY